MTAVTHISKVTLLELLTRMKVRRVQIITSCTKSKTLATPTPGDSNTPTQAVPAKDLYSGRQHTRLREIMDQAPDIEFDFKIVSAGHGLIDGDQVIESYDETFSGLTKSEIAQRAIILGLPQAFRDTVERTAADLTLVLLGEDYLDACAVSTPLLAPCPTLLIGNAACKLTIEGSNLFQIPIEDTDCQTLGAGQVWVKAEIANEIIQAIAA